MTKMKNLKQIIGIILIGIILCGCGPKFTEINVNESEKKATISLGGDIQISGNAMHSLVTYTDNANDTVLKEFVPTHAVYIFTTGTAGRSYSGPLIGPNGYNCLYSEDGYIYESITNVIVYDFR